MLVPYRNLYIIAGISVMLIVLATVVRISGSADRAIAERPKVPTVTVKGYPLDLAYDFYSPGAVNSANKEGTKSAGAPATASVSVTATAAPAKPADPVTARAYLAGNVKTGEIYLERSSSEPLPVASMSKLVTAFVVTETIEPEEVIEITPEAALAPPDKSTISAGEKYTAGELLYPLLLSSSNVAAEALASKFDRIKFLELMSSYAWEIGMPSTYFADPSGVSPNNRASAQDLFELAKYLFSSRPDILELTRTPQSSSATTTDHLGREFVSTHPFVKDPRFLGGKTGRTPEAGDTMLTILDIGGNPVAIIVLGSKYEARASDTAYLADKLQKKISGN